MKLARAWHEDHGEALFLIWQHQVVQPMAFSTLPLYLGSKKGAIISNKRGGKWKQFPAELQFKFQNSNPSSNSNSVLRAQFCS